MKTQNLEKRTNRAFNEVEKVRDKLTSVYVITKNGEKKGLISNRWTTYPHWSVAHVNFIMYGNHAIGDNVVLGGCGYNKFLHGIEYILGKLKEPLKEHFNIDVDGMKDPFNNWQNVFTSAGYSLIQVL